MVQLTQALVLQHQARLAAALGYPVFLDVGIDSCCDGSVSFEISPPAGATELAAEAQRQLAAALGYPVALDVLQDVAA